MADGSQGKPQKKLTPEGAKAAVEQAMPEISRSLRNAELARKLSGVPSGAFSPERKTEIMNSGPYGVPGKEERKRRPRD